MQYDVPYLPSIVFNYYLTMPEESYTVKIWLLVGQKDLLILFGKFTCIRNLTLGDKCNNLLNF
jgi:hypothetical protein